MEQLFYNDIIPPLLFFIAFFVAFSLLELIIIFILDKTERKHWEFMIDVVIRANVHHKTKIRIALLILAAALVFLVCKFTPIVDVWRLSAKEWKIFAVLLALSMILIYHIDMRKTTRIAIEKKIYTCVFFILSVPLYAAIVISANEVYPTYVSFINKNVINPTVRSVETTISEQKEQELLAKFQLMYIDDKCDKADYTTEEKDALFKNLALVSSQPEFAFGNGVTDLNNPESVLRGYNCTDGENTFLLTEGGDWYWVTEEYLIQKRTKN